MFDKLIDLFIQFINDFKPIVFIKEYENAVVYRGGKYLKILKPGPHLRIPYVDDIDKVNVNTATMCIREVNATTVDGKSISIAAQFTYKIINLHKAKVLQNGWEANIVNYGRSIISKQLINYTWQQIYADSDIAKYIGEIIASRAKIMGIEINDFEFTDKLDIIGLKLFNA